MMTTAQQILTHLERRPELQLKQDEPGKYRSNSPLRPGSNSHAFTLTIDTGGETGAYFDHVSDESGSLYQLAKLLNIPTPVGDNASTTKRGYAGLSDYAQTHHAPVEAFTAAGWMETTHRNRPALKFSTETGSRYRFIDGNKPPFIHRKGYRRCWYGLDRAVKLATDTGQPLVIANGEPSTVTAQHWRIAAACVTSGEKGNIPEALLSELHAVYTGPVLIVFDCDTKGRIAAPAMARQLQQAGFEAKAIDLQGGEGFDLADFCGLHKEQTATKLQTLPELKAEQTTMHYLNHAADDDGNAKCVLRDHPDRFTHNRAFGWLVYTGKYWTTEGAEITLNNAIVETLAKRQQAAIEASANKIFNAAKNDMNRINATRQRLQSLCYVSVSELDNDPDSLNCANGVVNLKTGEIVPHSPKQKNTYCLDYRYDPNCKNTLFVDWLLDAITPEGSTPPEYKSMLDWLQIGIGYSLTGRTDEQCLFYLFGPTRAGKGLLSQSISKLMGKPLAQSIGFETFTRRSTGNDQNFDLAPLKPSRVIFASESDSGQRLNEAKIKRITGNDDIYCAYKGKTHFSYTPQFKIWLSSNFPIATGNTNDDAFWGRVRVIEFPNSHLGNEDKTLARKLQSPEAMTGLLAWAIQGSIYWYEMLGTGRGLGIHDKIAAATNNHRNENDSVGCWLSEYQLEVVPVVRARSDYVLFCEENDYKPLRNRQLVQQLESAGYERKNRRTDGGQVKCWLKL